MNSEELQISGQTTQIKVKTEENVATFITDRQLITGKLDLENLEANLSKIPEEVQILITSVDLIRGVSSIISLEGFTLSISKEDDFPWENIINLVEGVLQEHLMHSK